MHRRALASLLLAALLSLPPAVAIAADSPDSLALDGTARDFRGYDLPPEHGLPRGHEDFENANGFETGIAKAALGADRKPVYNKDGVPSITTHGRAAFDQWFRDTPDVNLAEPIALAFARRPNGLYRYDDQTFFPLDDRGWIAQGKEPRRNDASGDPRNFSFTLELHSEIRYTGGESITVTGDDDIFVFVNGRLAIDLGGVHGPATGSFDFDARATAFGLTRGQLHDVDVFVAERHTSGSTLRIDTSRLGFDAGSATLPTSARLGDTVACAAAGWPAGVQLSYEWLRDGTPIAGATDSTRTTTSADGGTALACRVTGTRRTSASVTSAPLTLPRPDPDPPTPPGPGPGPAPGPGGPTPPGAGPLSPPAAVKLTEHPVLLTSSRTVRFAFATDPAAAGYECRLDGAQWERCSSPYVLADLRAGDHRIEIRAVMPDGRRGATARHEFQVNPYAPGLALPDSGLRAGASGAVRLRIACSPREGEGRGACRGGVRLQRRVGTGSRARTLVLARGRFDARAGATVTVTPRLTPAARALLAAARGGRLPLRVVLDARDLAGNRATVSFARTLRG